MCSVKVHAVKLAPLPARYPLFVKMNILLRFAFFCFDPLGIWRRFFINPALNVVLKIFDNVKVRAEAKVVSLKDLVLRVGIIAFVAVFILWAAVFMYVAFYYAYMPSISHVRPVHLQFKTCLDTGTPCTFPHAHVSLTKKQQLLMVGQAYKVIVDIEMPESPQNLDLGMFMICAEMRDQASILRGHSCRSTMMRYRSPMIRTISTWALSPLFVMGLKEEFQHVPVEIFSQYLEERQHPITDVYVELQSQKIHFYGVTLHIVADFSGLRYIMFNWPILSAMVAINTNLFFLLVIFLLSWYHWSNTTWLRSIKAKYDRITDTIHTASKAIESSGSFHDDEDLSFFDEKSNSSDVGDISTVSGLSGLEEQLDSTLEEQSLRKRKPKTSTF